MIWRIELAQAKGRTSKERIVLAERGDSNPGTRFSAYNGLANSRFHTLLFGINKLCSGENALCLCKTALFGTICATIVQPEFQRLP